MVKYTLKRILIAVVTLLVIIVILFCLLKLMPGSPFNNERMTDAQRAVLEAKYGLDKPLYLQILIYIKNMLTGNFGVSYSIQANYPVAQLIANKLPLTITIGLQAATIGIAVGMLLGIVAALSHNGFFDTLTTVVSMIGASIPSQVLALGLVYFLAYKLGWFPLTYTAKEPVLSTVLATASLAIFPMAIAARFTRNEMLEVLGSEYITLAETKGIPRKRVLIVHALKNTLVPLITALAPMIIGLMTGSTVIENIFSIPGIGKLFVTAITTNDYNVVLTLAFIFSAMYIGIMLVVDILYGIIDPRIRLTGGAK
jgi:oligopeptide transport system permease protein